MGSSAAVVVGFDGVCGERWNVVLEQEPSDLCEVHKEHKMRCYNSMLLLVF
jgi:hypothetical protein